MRLSLLCSALLFVLSVLQNVTPTTSTEGTKRVSGGQRDPETQKLARFMVSLRSLKPLVSFGDNHFCSGVIIGSSWVLTAASCASDKRKLPTCPRRMLVVAGTPNRLQKVDTTVELRVAAIHLHPFYVRKRSYNLAVIRVAGKFPTGNPNIEIMPLPTEKPPYGAECLTLGWGRIYFDGPLAAAVLHISLTLYKPEKCDAYYEFFRPGLLCAGDLRDKEKQACRGDSGGPLICNKKLTGITAWTKGCEGQDQPTRFMSVYHNLDFIVDAMNTAVPRALLLPILVPTMLCILQMF